MRRTVTIISSIFVLWSSFVYAVNPTDAEQLPPHKQAKLGPVGHDIVPGYVEQEPINDVIHSAMPREQQPQENTSKAQRLTDPAAPAGNDITKENLKDLLLRYETKNPPLNEEELMRVENFIIQSQEQKKSTISVNNYNGFIDAYRAFLLF